MTSSPKRSNELPCRASRMISAPVPTAAARKPGARLDGARTGPIVARTRLA